MKTHADKTQENKSPSVSVAGSQMQRGSKSYFQLLDNRPEVVEQRKLQEIANNSPQVQQAAQLQTMANNHFSQKQQPIQKKENNTGLPDNLKTGMETLSGYSMDDVKVHYNSDKPVQLQAHAYAQGTDIHISSGKEKHLPHEAWHVVQQKQGRVKATRQLKSNLNVNDDLGLEKEADVMGAKALNISSSVQSITKSQGSKEARGHLQPVSQLAEIIQRKKIEPKGINGLTHLVKMTDQGHIYSGENWLDNEREEVKTGDKLLVDMDEAWYSHRGINQEVNWQKDGEGEHDNLWVRVVELNHAPVENDLFVRKEMLSDGWTDWTESPKIMHSIWVQGDVTSNDEAMEGLESRRGKDTEDWVDMIWFYDTGVEQGEYEPQTIHIDSDKIAPLMKRSFHNEMIAWKKSGEMPEWVENWLPILNILYEKKSFITMSDLMRMIILYYEGGVYLDVKIKVNNDNAMFKEKPMVKVNTANFYSHENWAIMAHAGCEMIESMMIDAYKKFPSVDELKEYPTNYAEEPREDGKRREGKMHVNLHENLGVWNVIENAGRPGFETDLELTNPRPINSWSDAYEDRPREVVKEEEIRFLTDELNKLNRELTAQIQKKTSLEFKLSLAPNRIFWEKYELTQDIIDQLPSTIEEAEQRIELLEFQIELKQMDIESLLKQDDSDEVEQVQEEDPEMAALMARLNAL